MLRTTIFSLLIAVSAFYSSANASLLDGKNVGYAYYFPNTSTPIYFTTFVVGPGEELPNLFGTGGRGTLDVSDTNILVDFYADSEWTASDFNGFRLVDIDNTIDAFTSVAINAVTNFVGFDASRITFDADNIYVNWQGLTFTTDTVVSLDINGGSGTVPELPAYVTWAGLIVAVGLVGYVRHSKRRAILG